MLTGFLLILAVLCGVSPAAGLAAAHLVALIRHN
jgi:hypothetical protein